MTAAPDDPDRAFAAFVHRVASPLGAIANYAYLLQGEGSAESKEGIAAALGSTRALLADAQRWLDAVSTLAGPVPAGGADWERALRSAAANTDMDLEMAASPLPPVAAPQAALDRLADAILSDAAGASPPPAAVRVALESDAPHVSFTQPGRRWSEAVAARAFALFSDADPGSNAARIELPIAGTLAHRLGGRAWGASAADGEAIVHVVLPPAPRDARPPDGAADA